MFHFYEDYYHLIPLSFELCFVQPPKHTPTRVPMVMGSHLCASMDWPSPCDCPVKGCPRHFPGGEAKWRWTKTVLKREKYRCGRPSRKSSDHWLSLQSGVWAGDPLHSTCHCKVDTCGKWEWYVGFYFKCNTTMCALCRGIRIYWNLQRILSSLATYLNES